MGALDAQSDQIQINLILINLIDASQSNIAQHHMKTDIQVKSEDEPEIEGVWGEVEAACSKIPSVAEPRLHHLAHTLFVVRR